MTIDEKQTSLFRSIQEVYYDEYKSRESFNEAILLEQEHERILNEAVQFVNEAYVGKTPLLEKMEEQISIIRGKITRYTDYDTDPDVQKLNRMFEQQFGMDVFALHIDPHKTLNAYTMVISRTWDIAKSLNHAKWVTADRKDGFKFKPNNGFCISAVIYYGLIGNPELTDGEILAILLHELGHNFADFIDNKIKIANIKIFKGLEDLLLQECILKCIITLGIGTPIFVAQYIKYKNMLSNDYRRETEQKKQNQKQSKFRGAINGASAKVGDFIGTLISVAYKYNPINRIMARVAILTRGLYEDELKQNARKSLDRRNEIIADKFAGVYGYGPELATGLDKMTRYPTDSEKWIAKLPGGEKVNRIWEDLYKDITEFDCHPHHIQRLNENIKLLKDELKQEEMDPKMKGVIEGQIKELEDILKEIANRVKKDPNNITAAYDAFVNENLPDATTKKIEDEITNEFNDIMSKKK